jgi:hypothetical protein
MKKKINMKILFTGCTAKQTDDNAWKRARVKRIDDSSIICNSLRKQGYLVDRRKVKWGDDLSEYGLAIIGIGQFGSNNYSGEIFNVMYALKTVKNVIVFHEDWKIDGTMKSWEKMLDQAVFDKSISKKWSDGRYFYGGVDNPLFNPIEAVEVIRDIVDGKFENALIPAFDWGDKEKIRDIIKAKNIYNLDLTPYVLDNWNISINTPLQVKERKHMLASIVDHSPWVRRNKLKWPVDYFGAKSIKTAHLLDTETDVFETCGKYWGILCPEYPHAGSGWFRIRWIYAAIQQSILLSSPKDLEALGLPQKNIEELSDIQLKEYAQTQSSTILSYMWSKEDFDNRIHLVVSEVGSNCLTQNKQNYAPPILKQSFLF